MDDSNVPLVTQINFVFCSDWSKTWHKADAALPRSPIRQDVVFWDQIDSEKKPVFGVSDDPSRLFCIDRRLLFGVDFFRSRDFGILKILCQSCFFDF